MNRRLQLEPLEPRIVCAAVVVEFSINDDCVEVGETFVVDITVRDFHPWTGGLATVSVDVQWTGPVELVDYAITDVLAGHIVGAITPNSIDDLSGGSSHAYFGGIQTLGNFRDEVFASLEFRATGSGEVEFTANEGRNGIIPVPTAVFQPGQIEFAPATMHVFAESLACGMDE